MSVIFKNKALLASIPLHSTLESTPVQSASIHSLDALTARPAARARGITSTSTLAAGRRDSSDGQTTAYCARQRYHEHEHARSGAPCARQRYHEHEYARGRARSAPPYRRHTVTRLESSLSRVSPLPLDILHPHRSVEPQMEHKRADALRPSKTRHSSIALAGICYTTVPLLQLKSSVCMTPLCLPQFVLNSIRSTTHKCSLTKHLLGSLDGALVYKNIAVFGGRTVASEEGGTAALQPWRDHRV